MSTTILEEREWKILIYLDTSAIVSYYVPEKLSSVVEQLLQKQEYQPINSIYNCMISVLQLQ